MSKEKINLYVLTGFLGSGKTTVLLNILDTLKDEKVGIIQNEFGKLGIDGIILKKNNIEMIEINKGSIFCSCLKLSFAQALAEMAKMDLKYVFVESSGLADPSNIEEILEGVKIIAGDRYTFKGAICLIDGINFKEQLNDMETVNRQLKHCHMAVVNKADKIGETELLSVIEAVKTVNPVCPINVCEFGVLDMSFLKTDLLQYSWAEGEETTNSVENKPKSLVLNFKGKTSKIKFENFLNSLKSDCYRIKGFFCLDDMWQQVDLVGQNIDYKPCEPSEISQIVIISKIGPKIIKPIIDNWNDIVGEKMELKN